MGRSKGRFGQCWHSAHTLSFLTWKGKLAVNLPPRPSMVLHPGHKFKSPDTLCKANDLCCHYHRGHCRSSFWFSYFAMGLGHYFCFLTFPGLRPSIVQWGLQLKACALMTIIHTVNIWQGFLHLFVRIVLTPGRGTWNTTEENGEKRILYLILPQLS